MSGLRTIDVSVPHTLGVATAWGRVIRWLSSNTNTPGIKPLKTDINHARHRIELSVEAYDYIVSATVTVTDSRVDVISSAIDGMFPLVVAGAGIAETRITSQLTEALR